MPEIVSHGVWASGPDVDHPGGFRYLTFARADGLDWYAHAHEHLVDTSTRKVLVRDGVALMIERDGTRLVPPGEVFEVSNDVSVERNWLWRDGVFVEPTAPAPADTAAKLRAFLDANPDVKAILA